MTRRNEDDEVFLEERPEDEPRMPSGRLRSDREVDDGVGEHLAHRSASTRAHRDANVRKSTFVRSQQ